MVSGCGLKLWVSVTVITTLVATTRAPTSMATPRPSSRDHDRARRAAARDEEGVELANAVLG